MILPKEEPRFAAFSGKSGNVTDRLDKAGRVLALVKSRLNKKPRNEQLKQLKQWLLEYRSHLQDRKRIEENTDELVVDWEKWDYKDSQTGW